MSNIIDLTTILIYGIFAYAHVNNNIINNLPKKFSINVKIYFEDKFHNTSFKWLTSTLCTTKEFQMHCYQSQLMSIYKEFMFEVLHLKLNYLKRMRELVLP